MDTERSRIIIVNDNLPKFGQCRNLLKNLFDVYSASSAMELFKILEDIIPDLILLNIDVPETNRDETIMQLKTNERFSNIPIVFLTEKQ